MMRYHSFALERVRRFRQLLTDLREGDYPFPHSGTALELLDRSFGELEGQLVAAQRASEEVRKTLAQRTLEEISNKLPVLGLIDRSASVDGPVEFHGPFCRMIRAVLGAEAKLILASDWSYSPYTYIYPDLFPNDQFVIVALPASEAGHVLGLPLAGHELGHNVWAAENLRMGFTQRLASTIQELIGGQFKELYSKHIGSREASGESNQDLFGDGSPPWLICLTYAIKQCEELFCDFFGVALFGESYLSSFEYLTAPWTFARVPEYPAMADRLLAQAQCAREIGVALPDYYIASGLVAHVEDDVMLQIADVATRRQMSDLILSARSIVESRFSVRSTSSEVERISKCFQGGRPANNVRCVPDVLNAAWRCAADANFHADKVRLTNELTLKTLEVHEIEVIQEEAKCSTQARLLN